MCFFTLVLKIEKKSVRCNLGPIFEYWAIEWICMESLKLLLFQCLIKLSLDSIGEIQLITHHSINRMFQIKTKIIIFGQFHGICEVSKCSLIRIWFLSIHSMWTPPHVCFFYFHYYYLNPCSVICFTLSKHHKILFATKNDIKENTIPQMWTMNKEWKWHGFVISVTWYCD